MLAVRQGTIVWWGFTRDNDPEKAIQAAWMNWWQSISNPGDQVPYEGATLRDHLGLPRPEHRLFAQGPDEAAEQQGTATPA